MTADLAELTLQFIDQYGMIAVFVLLFMDGAMLLPLVPGEVIMILAVARYAHDPVSLAILITVASVAATLGSLFLYGIARGGGRRLIENHPRLFMLSPRKREKLERVFSRPVGQSLVLFLRLFPLTRVLVNLPAGLARMKFIPFLLLTLIGMVTFHAAFMFLAYELRDPGSPVSVRANALSEAYASPAFAYMQANWLLTAASVLGLGILLSLRATHRAAKLPPEEVEGSLIGSLTTLLLFWGGAGLLAVLWIDPSIVFQTAIATGYDLEQVQIGAPYEPLSLVAATGAYAMLMGLLLASARQSAKRRSKERALKTRQDALAPRTGPTPQYSWEETHSGSTTTVSKAPSWKRSGP